MATRVTVPGASVTFPAICPCCGAAADTVFEAVEKRKLSPLLVYTVGPSIALFFARVNASSVQVPYCSRCRDHAKWSDGRLIWFLPVAAPVALYFIFFSPSSDATPLALLGLAAAAAVWWAVALLIGLRFKNSNCASLRPAVNYSYADPTENTFEFENEAYVREFRKVNIDTLLNLPSHE